MDKRVSEYISESQFAYANKRFDESILKAKKALALDRHALAAYLQLGMCYLILNKCDEAESEIKKGLRLDAKNGILHFLLGSVYFKKKCYNDSLLELAKAEQFGCPDKIKQKLYFMAGSINQYLKNYKEALINYKKSEDIPLPNENHTDILLQKIEISVDMNKFHDAENYSRELKLLTPSDFKVYQLLFQLQVQQEKLELALDTLNEAEKYCELDYRNEIELEFDFALLDCYKANKYSDRKNEYYNLALDRLIKLGHNDLLSIKDNYEVCLTIAEIYMKMDCYKEAINYVENVAKSKEYSYIELIERAKYMLVELYYHIGQYDTVIYWAKELKKCQEKTYVYHGYYVEAALTMKKSQKDKLLYEKALELYEYAIAYYRQETSVDPSQVMANFYRVKCYADIGKFEQAQKLLALFPKTLSEELIKYMESLKE